MEKSVLIKIFSKKLYELRKEKKWSQNQLASIIGTSAPIIGRYERGEIVPSIEVAKKIADALEVSIDSLVEENRNQLYLKDKENLLRWGFLDEMSKADKEHILFVIDALIRDAKARKAYKT